MKNNGAAGGDRTYDLPLTKGDGRRRLNGQDSRFSAQFRSVFESWTERNQTERDENERHRLTPRRHQRSLFGLPAGKVYDYNMTAGVVWRNRIVAAVILGLALAQWRGWL